MHTHERQYTNTAENRAEGGHLVTAKQSDSSKQLGGTTEKNCFSGFIFNVYKIYLPALAKEQEFSQ